MSISRRSFLGMAVAASLTPTLAGKAVSNPASVRVKSNGQFDPWVEVDPAALRSNTQQVTRLAGGRPILAVVKNNAYGLDLVKTARILETFPEIGGFAAVKAESCVTLRDAGIRKPILLMGLTPEQGWDELIASDIQLSVYTPEAVKRLTPLAEKARKPVVAHFYLDTGMSRLGMPYHKALPWMAEVTASNAVEIVGTFMAFTEESDFDPEQLRRFLELATEAKERGIGLGRLHAASSNGVYHMPEAHLDLVRPGIALYGAYPSKPDEEKAIAELTPAFALRVGVVRVEQLRKGDSVSYGRNYVAEKPTWAATLAIGHADGFPRESVNGGRVLIGDRTYPVIGAVSASHAIVEVGDERSVNVGDTATLFGPGHPDIHPNRVAETLGISVYDVLMHMNPSLERVIRRR